MGINEPHRTTTTLPKRTHVEVALTFLLPRALISTEWVPYVTLNVSVQVAVAPE